MELHAFAYLDDIVVIRATKEQHVANLKEFFRRLRAAKLRVNRKKCSFFREKLAYLGHTTAPILACPDLSAKFVLQTDASDHGLGAVLMQEVEGQERVIAYASRKLSKADLNYSATEKECLAIVWAIRKMRCYLKDYRFDVVTDHLALKWLNSIESTTGRIARWALQLQQYQFDTRYRRGSLNVVADALSRQPLGSCQQAVEDDPPCEWIKRMRERIAKVPEKFQDYVEENGQLYRSIGHRIDEEDFIPWKLCVPMQFEEQSDEGVPRRSTAGHQGVRKTAIRLAHLLAGHVSRCRQ
ncbi:hypothetical protein AWZ03_015115, partial [Drosophila navojoa]